jgi:hypothetical protein
VLVSLGEVMTAIPNIAPHAHVGAEAASPAAAASNTGPFVLNLCSSTTPMALAQTDLPELKRFTFFVSRRFEEGRERFRLHMGYFATLAEAEEWLVVVREIYPGAWAGESPGRKLRERAAAAAAAQAQHAAGPQPRVAPAAAREAAALLARASASPIPLNVPVVHAPVVQPAPAPARAAPAVTRAPAPPVAAPAAALAARRAPPAPIPAARAAMPTAAAAPARPAAAPKFAAAVTAWTPPARAVPPAAPAAVASQARLHPEPRAAAAQAHPAPGRKGVFEDSNVREVLAALGDSSATGETRLMRTPPPRPAAPPPASGALSDTQVLKLLETRGPEGGQQVADVSGGSIPFLKPDDTATRRALQEAVANNAPVAFAVQLQWSVQPADLLKVPPLAIFSAYTLYTVEGSRDGRKWYGLRLGFFSDAISAKQVAHYVRSEFTSVAVVPVSPQERVRATEQDKKVAMVAVPDQARAGNADEFKLLDDDGSRFVLPKGPPPAVAPGARRAAAKPAAAADTKAQPKVAVGRAVRQDSAGAAVRGKSGGKVGARERRGAQTLEETLEILGASALTIDTGNGETLNDSGVRHLHIEHKNSPFARLLERLSERVKKP